MKKIIFITGLILILLACGKRFNGIVETAPMADMPDENLVMKYDASLATNKKPSDQDKQSGCRHYHKKKYE